jgi:hypothetical protein
LDTARDYLQGIWLVGRNPDKGTCAAHWYDWSTQVEFEYRRSGGRVLIYEPPDLFTAIAIPYLSVDDDVLTIWAQKRDGPKVLYLRLRKLGEDRMELLSTDPSKTPTIAYRCGSPDLSVNAAVPMERIALLTPSLSGALSFPETEAGVSDRDVCQGRGANRGRLQFELLGPVHYWVFGTHLRQGNTIEFDLVRQIHAIDAHTLKLDMQKHDSREGWDAPPSRGERYTLTIVDKPDRIEIPELSSSFVKCRPDEPGSARIHRW